jgi:hypothetical protein
MASYSIEWKRSAIRELRNLPKEIIPKIAATIGELSANPFPYGVKKLSGAEHTYRIRQARTGLFMLPPSPRRSLRSCELGIAEMFMTGRFSWFANPRYQR